VAELADAQVSEACDGDIVEVQVLSSAPNPVTKGVGLLIGLAFFRHNISNTQLAPGPAELRDKFCHKNPGCGVHVLEVE
jgi:hypothetical protein